MVSSLKRSTKCRRGHETAPHSRRCQRQRRPVDGSSSAAFAHPQHEPTVVSMTAPARSATAKYHSLTVAKRGGYSILADSAGITCITEPHMGAMGVHYVKGDLVKNPAIDAAHPEALVYAPDRHGHLYLAALEYVVIK